MSGAAGHPWNFPKQAGALLAPAEVTGDPFWLTDAGERLRLQMADVQARTDAERAGGLAKQRAEKELEREIAAAEWRARQETERAEAEAREQEERDAQRDRMAALDAELNERAAAIEAAETALATHDSDFHAFAVTVDFYVDGYDGADSDSPASEWVLTDDEDENAVLVAQVGTQVISAISPWLTHFGAIGFVRADGLGGALMGGLVAGSAAPTFYMVYRAADADADITSLGEFQRAGLTIDALPGASLVINSIVRPINATLLVNALRDCIERVGPWGGDAGVAEVLPAEKRKAFLGRAALVREKAARLVDRWHRCAGDLELFGMLGSADERASGHEKFEWVVEGRLARGYVTLLAGDSGSGKSSLAHEIVAALGSPAAEIPRTVLGAVVTGKFEVALISGEDRADRINERASFHSKKWGECSYFVKVKNDENLEEILIKLERLPGLDLVVIDPVRSFLDGDEDSSAIVDKFYNRLSSFADTMRCAVLVVHHLSKGVCRRLMDMKQKVRGSGAHTAHVRMAIGMIDRGNDRVEIGPIKCNLSGAWLPENQGEFYQRDATTFTLDLVTPARTQLSRAAAGESDASADRVLAALADRNRAGVVTRKSGRSGLFEAQLPRLAGLSRTTIQTLIASLIESAQIADDGGSGLLVASPSALSSKAV